MLAFIGSYAIISPSRYRTYFSVIGNFPLFDKTNIENYQVKFFTKKEGSHEKDGDQAVNSQQDYVYS
ncbi:hypothetical protein G3KMM_00525 [Candidatus Nanosyncoccus nanoralicus]|uniref:Uncharacterized protein n=1 Tax=Candidatus Nanosyncoccus nanoralicus TaxID=2171996 RepID=A0ABY0FJF3_9BACT|nr:hypothetical protein G3KMM_00525 [Candidatus Nanosyncoccus nanoralicus]